MKAIGKWCLGARFLPLEYALTLSLHLRIDEAVDQNAVIYLL